MEKLIDSKTGNKVKEILEEVQDSVQLVLIRDESEYSEITQQLLTELKELNDKIDVQVYNVNSDEYSYEIEKNLLPAIIILDSEGNDLGVRFYGIPSGHEFSTLLEDIIAVANMKIDAFNEENMKKLYTIDKKMRIRVFVTPTCPYCPKAVYAAHQVALINHNIIGEMIEANEFDQLSFEYGVSSVPHTVIEINENGKWIKKNEFVGAYPEQAFVEEILKAAE